MTDALRERIARAMVEVYARHTFNEAADNEVVPADLEAADAALAVIEPLLEAMRRHIRSYEPGTLVGSELNVAHQLRALDGEVWAPWCVPGDTVSNCAADFAELCQMVEASGTHAVVPLEPTPEMRAVGCLDNHSGGAGHVYRVMLAARPRQPSPEE